jgi:cation diffusion facilitator CzcD-associated flavoprotein CzcO
MNTGGAHPMPLSHQHNKPDIAIIGSGIAGICMGIKLKQAGILDFVIYEKASEIGGTWRDNTYPGCACDVPLHIYEFSFAMNADWIDKFSSSQEIKAYLERVVDQFGLRPYIRFNTEINNAEFNESTGTWNLHVGDEKIEVQTLISGTGQLNRPKFPDIPGRETFAGESWHSARWNHDYDLNGKSVAVIGTGASAIQFVPEIAKQAGHLDVFQRSPSWVMPRPQREFKPWERALYKNFPFMMRIQRMKIYWQGELIFWVMNHLGKLMSMAARKQIRTHILDEAKRKVLTPDYPLGCKRILVSDDWYPALAASHVDLVTDAIARITPEGIETKDDKLHKCDAIIFGTGFDTTHFLGAANIAGLGGRKLADDWKSGAEAHRGITVTGYPNFFMLYGPNTNLGHNSIIFMIECQANYIVQCVQKLRERDLLFMNVTPEAQRASNEIVQRDARKSVFSAGCTSWYKTADGKITNNWANYTFKYWWWTRKPDFAEFELRSRNILRAAE